MKAAGRYNHVAATAEGVFEEILALQRLAAMCRRRAATDEALQLFSGECLRRVWVLALLAGSTALAQSPARPATASGASGITPFARGEVLNYTVSWPSGLSLGEAQFKAGGGEPGWDFELTIDASLPAFDIKDHYRSTADAQFCSSRLEKESTHGPRKTRETVTYDQQKHQGVRQTTGGGGKTEFQIGECLKDALTFVYVLRRELANRRVPPAQTVNFGSQYQVTATYADSPQIDAAGTRQQADRVVIAYRGPVASHSFEIFFARDAARTPLVIRVPFSLGNFALELVR